MAMEKGKDYKEGSKVLVFNPLKRLIAIYSSVNATAKLLNVCPATVSLACSGKSVSCSKFYLRFVYDNVEVTTDDLGVLRVEEYDKLCGLERKYYLTKKMTRVGMKYKKKKNNKKASTQKQEENED